MQFKLLAQLVSAVSVACALLLAAAALAFGMMPV